MAPSQTDLRGPLVDPNRVRVAPSVLSADFASLGEAIRGLEGVTDILHVDVMDGHFVPNLTIGPPVVASLRRSTDLYLDCHLMMSDPGLLIPAFADAGADGCTVHVELGGERVSESLQAIRSLGMGVGLSLNPATPYEAVEPFLESIDLLLIMSVVPGFGGQSFMGEVLSKVRRARADIDQRGLEVVLQIDGGIGTKTVGDSVRAGARCLVAGTAVFGAADSLEATRLLTQLGNDLVEQRSE